MDAARSAVGKNSCAISFNSYCSRAVSHEVSDMLWEELSVLNEVAEKEKKKKMTERQRQKLEVDKKCIYYTERKTLNKGSVLLRTFISWDQENVSNSSSLFEKNLEMTSPSMVKPVTLKTVAPSLSVEW